MAQGKDVEISRCQKIGRNLQTSSDYMDPNNAGRRLGARTMRWAELQAPRPSRLSFCPKSTLIRPSYPVYPFSIVPWMSNGHLK